MWNSKTNNPIGDGVYIVFCNGSKFVAYYIHGTGWHGAKNEIENIDHKVDYWFDLQFLANPFEATLTALPACVTVENNIQPSLDFKNCETCNIGMLITDITYSCNCGNSITEKLPIVTIANNQ